jgi:hypothetical protein
LFPEEASPLVFLNMGFHGDPDVDGRIILRWIFGKWEGLWGLDGVGSG